MKRCCGCIVVLLLLAGCHREPSIPARATWKGSITLPGNIAVPLRMDLNFSGPKPEGAFLVGEESTPIPEIAREGDTVIFDFPEYSAEIRSAWNGTALSGNYLRIRADGTKSFSFTAAPETSDERAAASPGAPAPEGNYQVFFQAQDKVDDTTVAKFWRKDGRLFGTFIAPDGDYGLLEGNPSGQQIHFTRFTGWQAIAIVLASEGGTWTGSFHAASEDKPRPFILQPRADLKLETPAAMRTTLKNPGGPFRFACTGASGETVRETDDRFKGKALIADMMGTWCHNCLDEAPVLQKLQEQFGNEGLEVVGLSFEISDDPELGSKNLELFRKRFGLTYTLLFCGSLDEENVKTRIHSQFENFFAFPTAIFIDKNRKVRSIHSGFKGPGTGDEFQAQVREFEELARSVVQF